MKNGCIEKKGEYDVRNEQIVHLGFWYYDTQWEWKIDVIALFEEKNCYVEMHDI